jgi:hypothetical protein
VVAVLDDTLGEDVGAAIALVPCAKAYAAAISD